jgi:hypothetical protein
MHASAVAAVAASVLAAVAAVAAASVYSDGGGGGHRVVEGGGTSGGSVGGIHAEVHRLLSMGEYSAVVRRVDATPRTADLCPESVCSISTGVAFHPLSFMRGVALYRMGKLQDAAASFATALLSDPNNEAAWLNLGDLCLFQFDVKRAIWAYEEGIFVHRVVKDVSKVGQAAAAMQP